MKARYWSPVCLAPLLAASAVTTAQAQPQPPAAALPTASAPAGGGQGALTVGVLSSPQGLRLAAAACAQGPCPLSSSAPLSFSPAPPQELLAQAKINVLPIGQGHHLVRVDVGESTQRWQALLAAPLGGANAPVVLWSNPTPDVPAEAKDSAPALQVTDPEADGSVKVLVGESRPELNLCGRPTLLMPRLVDPRDLQLKHAKMQRLTPQERSSAEQLTAQRLTEAPPTPLVRLLSSVGASSAVGSPTALSDDNLETFWSEARGEEGRGEFAVFRSSSSVPIVSLTFTVRPPKTEVPQGVSPKTFWVAADQRLLQVTLPEDAWKRPGAQYAVHLDKPLQTSCVAVVLGDAYLGRDPKKAQVTLSEVTAGSQFDGTTDIKGLVALLSGEEAKAQAAADVLRRGGPSAYQATLEGYPSLNASGQTLAQTVLEAAPCSVSAPFFASLLDSQTPSERAHARDRLQRCGRASGPALSAIVAGLPAACASAPEGTAECTPKADAKFDAKRLLAATELASLAPDMAVEQLAPVLGDAKPPLRRALRTVLANASSHRRAAEPLGKHLLDTKLSAAATLDLLRSAQDHLEPIREQASSAFARLATPQADLSTRYLLCAPAARLASLGDAKALAYLGERIGSDPEPMVRAHAAELAAELTGLAPALAKAIGDPHMRVRDAALRTLKPGPSLVPSLVERLQKDDWPLVRGDAARALAQTGPSDAVDQALGKALTDPSRVVRQEAALALGARGAMGQASALRERADDAEESVQVRAAAIRALGQMCDPKALELLTTLAQRSSQPQSPEAQSGLGTAAIYALGQVHPTDLAKRLAPLLEPKAPAQMRAAAQAAMQARPQCSAKPLPSPSHP